ncbi:hypothetical protein DFP72DRAFT_895016 [Ephemerocybe angulata]|uniref:Secreted protein n=1 Tax=Ephemerocybe angulata TaxID=980116 RepID=A0A8H6I1D8_9AGAR|nr:hypothetical protein DFP72DRAFT_895016 [Tulosesus angulatus]
MMFRVKFTLAWFLLFFYPLHHPVVAPLRQHGTVQKLCTLHPIFCRRTSGERDWGQLRSTPRESIFHFDMGLHQVAEPHFRTSRYLLARHVG